MQEVISAGKSLIVVQPNFVEELLCLQGKGARPGSASLGGGVQSGAAIRDMTVRLVVVYFPSFRRVRVHVDCGARVVWSSYSVVHAGPETLEEETTKEGRVRRGEIEQGRQGRQVEMRGAHCLL